MEAVIDFISRLPHEWAVFITAMVPLIEARGSIILGYSFGMPWVETFLISAAGNFLPIPFILLFIRKIIECFKTIPALRKLAEKIEMKAVRNATKVRKGSLIALCIFVGIPLPGTGAWTGALIADLLDLRFKHSLIALFIGIMIACFIMCGLTYGFLGFLNNLFVF